MDPEPGVSRLNVERGRGTEVSVAWPGKKRSAMDVNKRIGELLLILTVTKSFFLHGPSRHREISEFAGVMLLSVSWLKGQGSMGLRDVGGRSS